MPVHTNDDSVAVPSTRRNNSQKKRQSNKNLTNIADDDSFRSNSSFPANENHNNHSVTGGNGNGSSSNTNKGGGGGKQRKTKNDEFEMMLQKEIEKKINEKDIRSVYLQSSIIPEWETYHLDHKELKKFIYTEAKNHGVYPFLYKTKKKVGVSDVPQSSTATGLHHQVSRGSMQDLTQINSIAGGASTGDIHQMMTTAEWDPSKIGFHVKAEINKDFEFVITSASFLNASGKRISMTVTDNTEDKEDDDHDHRGAGGAGNKNNSASRSSRPAGGGSSTVDSDEPLSAQSPALEGGATYVFPTEGSPYKPHSEERAAKKEGGAVTFDEQTDFHVDIEGNNNKRNSLAFTTTNDSGDYIPPLATRGRSYSTAITREKSLCFIHEGCSNETGGLNLLGRQGSSSSAIVVEGLGQGGGAGAGSGGKRKDSSQNDLHQDTHSARRSTSLKSPSSQSHNARSSSEVDKGSRTPHLRAAGLSGTMKTPNTGAFGSSWWDSRPIIPDMGDGFENELHEIKRDKRYALATEMMTRYVRFNAAISEKLRGEVAKLNQFYSTNSEVISAASLTCLSIGKITIGSKMRGADRANASQGIDTNASSVDQSKQSFSSPGVSSAPDDSKKSSPLIPGGNQSSTDASPRRKSVGFGVLPNGEEAPQKRDSAVSSPAPAQENEMTEKDVRKIDQTYGQLVSNLDRLQQFCEHSHLATADLLKHVAEASAQVIDWQKPVTLLPYYQPSGYSSVLKLREVVVQFYSEQLCKGDMVKAKRRLAKQSPGGGAGGWAAGLPDSLGIILGAGLLAGAVIALAIAVLWFYSSLPLKSPAAMLEHPYSLHAGFLFTLSGIPVLHLTLFPLDVLMWKVWGVNYPFLFARHPVKHMTCATVILRNYPYTIIWLLCALGYLRSEQLDFAEAVGQAFEYDFDLRGVEEFIERKEGPLISRYDEGTNNSITAPQQQQHQINNITDSSSAPVFTVGASAARQAAGTSNSSNITTNNISNASEEEEEKTPTEDDVVGNNSTSMPPTPSDDNTLPPTEKRLVFSVNDLITVKWDKMNPSTWHPLTVAQEESTLLRSRSRVFPTFLWPYLMFVFFLIVLIIQQISMTIRKESRWFFRHLGRMLVTPYFRVNYSDYFMAIQSVSMMQILVEWQWFWMVFLNDHRIGLEQDPRSFFFLILPLFPGWVRIGQASSRFYHEPQNRGFFPHIVVMVSFTLTFLRISSQIGYLISGSRYMQNHPDDPTTDSERALAVGLFATFGGCDVLYKWWYDMWVEWGVLRRKAKYWMLRDQILYPQWTYYVALIFNACIRLLFPFIHFVFRIQPWNAPWVFTLEIFRRAVWNLYRMDNEMYSNIERYRIVEVAPMPVKIASRRHGNADENGEGGGDDDDYENFSDADWMIGEKELQRFKSAVKLKTNSRFTTLYRLNRFFVNRIPQEEQILILKGVLPEDTEYMDGSIDDIAAMSTASPYDTLGPSPAAQSLSTSQHQQQTTGFAAALASSATNAMSYMLTKFFRLRSINSKALRGTPVELYNGLAEEEKTRAFMLRVGPGRKISDYVDWISTTYGAGAMSSAAASIFGASNSAFFGPVDAGASLNANGGRVSPGSAQQRRATLMSVLNKDALVQQASDGQ